MCVLQVVVVFLRVDGGVPAVLTYVHLGSPLLVAEVERETVNLAAMALQGAALGEGLLTHLTFVGANSWRERTR